MRPILTAKEAAELRDRTIEECARAVENVKWPPYGTLLQRDYAAAIRALKEKP